MYAKSRTRSRQSCGKNPPADLRRYVFAAGDNKKLDKLVSEISDAIAVLERLLDSHRKLQYNALFDMDEYESLKDKSIDELVNSRRQAQDAGNRRTEAAASVVLATQGAADELLHHRRADQGLEHSRPFKSLLSGDIDLSDDRDKFGRAIGTLSLPGGSRDVLIEFKEKRLPDGLELAQQEDIDYLCNMLSTGSPQRPDHLRTLQCLGHLDLESFRDQFLLVHALPAGSEPSMPANLFDVLNSREYHATPLEERLSLALGIAKSVLLFLSLGWLHKGIRSSNIIFVKSRTETRPLSGRSALPGRILHRWI